MVRAIGSAVAAVTPTRVILIALAALAWLATLRRRDLRPLAWTLTGLAAVDCARIVTHPRSLALGYPWRGVDHALVALWPGVVAVGVLSGLKLRRVAVVAFLAYALMLGFVVAPRLVPWFGPELAALALTIAMAAPRVAAVIIAAIALLAGQRATAALGHALLAVGLAAALPAWWSTWTIARWVSLATWVAVGATILLALRRKA